MADMKLYQNIYPLSNSWCFQVTLPQFPSWKSPQFQAPAPAARARVQPPGQVPTPAQLPAREQVRGFYREFISEQCTKHSELSESQTIRKQLEVLKKIHYKKNRRKTQNKQLPDLNALQRSLYEAFYGREMSKAQYEELLRLLKELKKQM